MGHTAALVVVAAGRRARRAAGGLDRFVDGQDDIGNPHISGLARQKIAAAGAAHAFDQPALAQAAKQLLQIGQGNFLAIGDIGQSHRLAPEWAARSAMAITA